jgi:L-asparaginase type II
MTLLRALMVVVLPVASTVLSAQATAPKPKVLVIGTGGTISGVQEKPGTTAAYRAGGLTTEQIVASVPGLDQIARIETEQFANVPSSWITPAQWLGLSKRINTVLRERADIAGIVVTHGTDRLEETAFFLYLTIRSPKPVVVVGAQHPATGLSPDGPINLLSAIRTAASPAAVGKGVLVELDDRLISAREVRKQYPRMGGFSGGEMGIIGVATNDGPEFFFAPTRRQGVQSEFDVLPLDSLPSVELHYAYPGGRGPAPSPAPGGVVVSSTGFTRAEGDTYRAWRKQGTIVVTAFPSGDNVARVSSRDEADFDTLAPPKTVFDTLRLLDRRAPPIVSVQHLTPQKARILLMLALTRTHEPKDVQRIFAEY